MDKFYIGINGVQKGPFSKDELKAQGLKPSTLVWTDGMENWLQAIEVEKLKGLFQGTPPPIPNQNKPPIPVEIEKPIRVKAEISKKKEPLISNEGKVTVLRHSYKPIYYLTHAIPTHYQRFGFGWNSHSVISLEEMIRE